MFRYITVSYNTLKIIRKFMNDMRARTYSRFFEILFSFDRIDKISPALMLILNEGKNVAYTEINRKFRKLSSGSIRSYLDDIVEMNIGFAKSRDGYIYNNNDNKRKLIPIKGKIWKKIMLLKIKYEFKNINDVVVYLIVRSHNKLLNQIAVAKLQNIKLQRDDNSSSE